MSYSDYSVASIPFVGGIDTKSDAKTVKVGKLTVLENGVFTEGGSVKKRRGYRSVAAETVGGVSVDGTPTGIGSRGNELVMLTDEKLYGYSARADAWVERGAYCPYGFTATEVVAGNTEQGLGECATANGVTCYVWAEGTSIYAAAYDDETGAAFVGRTLMKTGGERPRAVAVGGTVVLLWVDTASTRIEGKPIRSWDVATDMAASEVIVASDLGSDLQFDAAEATDDYAVLAYSSDGLSATGVRVGHLNASAGLSSLKDTGTAASADGLSIAYDGDDLIWLAYHGSGTTEIFKYTLSDMVLVASSSSATNNSDTLSLILGDQGGLFLAYDFLGASADVNEVRIQGFDSDTLALSGSYITVGHSSIASQAFTLGDKAYLIVAHESRTGLQNAYYLVDMEGNICGQLFWGEGGYEHSGGDYLPRTRRSTRGAQIPLLFKRQVDVEDDDLAVFEHKGLRRVVFDSEPTVSTAEADGVLYAGGPLLWAYDGTNVTEANPLMFPDMALDGSDAAPYVGPNGTMATADTVQIRVYYEWRNALGQRCRSMAVQFQYEHSGGDGGYTLTIPTLSHTNVDDVAIVVYQTAVGSTTPFYRASSPDPSTAGSDGGWIENDPTVDTVTWNYDDSPVGNEIDYLTSNQLANEPPKSGKYLATVGSRLFMVGNEVGPNRVQYSKLRQPGEPFHFSGELVADDGPAEGGRIQGVSHLNGIPVVFKERSIYALEGEGPDNLGLAGVYVSRSVTTDVGLSDPLVHVITPQGVCFKSAKGFYLLDQGLNVHYLGAEAEGYNSQTYKSAAIVPDTNTAVFLAENGKSVIYDYYYGQWGTWTNHDGASSCIVGTDYAYLKPDGRVYVQSSDYTDAGAPYAMRVRSAPFRPVDVLQGFWKLIEFQVLGDYESAHKLLVSLYYNRDQAPFETYTLNTASIISSEAWGAQGSWGADSVWGGSADGSEYQHSHRPKRTKCQTISFEFQDIPGDSPGASYELTEIALRYLPWSGLARLSTARKY